MNYLKQKIANHYYTYVPGEFLPIFSGGELLNEREFAVYKAKRAIRRYAPRAIAQLI